MELKAACKQGVKHNKQTVKGILSNHAPCRPKSSHLNGWSHIRKYPTRPAPCCGFSFEDYTVHMCTSARHNPHGVHICQLCKHACTGMEKNAMCSCWRSIASTCRTSILRSSKAVDVYMNHMAMVLKCKLLARVVALCSHFGQKLNSYTFSAAMVLIC